MVQSLPRMRGADLLRADDLFAANGPTGDVLVGDLNGDGLQGPGGARALGELRRGAPRQRDRRFRGADLVLSDGRGTHEGVLLDLNSDGRLDIALEGLVDAFVLFGNGSGGFVRQPVTSASAAIVGDVRAGDFNSDGRPDLAITTFGTSNQLHIRLNNGSGAFVETATPIPLPASPDRIVVQDLNGDGRPDLALSYTSFNGSQPADRVVDPARRRRRWVRCAGHDSAGGEDSERAVFGLGDINGDSHTDLARHRGSGATRLVYLLLGNGAGGFTPQLLADRCRQAFRVEAGDINGDGRTGSRGVRAAAS